MAKGLAVIQGTGSVVFKALENGDIVLGQNVAANVAVSGSLKLTLAGVGAGKFLKSDADGQATWAQIAISDVDGLQTALDNLENSLGGDFASLSQALSSEVVRAQGAESSLASDVAALDGRIDALIGDENLSGTLSTIQEIQNYLDGEENVGATVVQGISDLTTYAKTLSSELASEVARAEAAEAGLSSDLAAEVVRAEAAEASLSTEIVDEVARLEGLIDSAGGDTSALSVALDNEIARATGVEAALSAEIDAEEARAQAAEAGLSADLAAEVARATDAEAALSAEISDLGNNEIIVVGTSNEVEVTDGTVTLSAGGTITLGLPDDVIISNSLTVNGNATLGSDVGDLVQINGKMRVTHVLRTDTAVLAAYSNATDLAAGDFDGHMFYLKGDNDENSMFAQGNKWYFCEAGVWHSSFFYVGA